MKRDPIAWPEPKVFRAWLVNAVSADKPAGEGPIAAQLQPAAAAAGGSADASAVQEYPWGDEDGDAPVEDVAMVEEAAQDQEGDDDTPAASDQLLEEKTTSYVALPSGLTPWWVKFLLKQGVNEASQWAYLMGVGTEIELPTDMQAQRSSL